jgi:hypothetical protein
MSQSCAGLPQRVVRIKPMMIFETKSYIFGKSEVLCSLQGGVSTMENSLELLEAEALKLSATERAVFARFFTCPR